MSSGKSKSQNRVVAPRNIPDVKTPKNIYSANKYARNLVQGKQRMPHHHASIDLSSRDHGTAMPQENYPIQRLRSDPRVVAISSEQVAINPANYSRFANGNKRNESVGMSRAMGGLGSANRYDGVHEAIAVARELSKENYQRHLIRGPCPIDYKNRR